MDSNRKSADTLEAALETAAGLTTLLGLKGPIAATVGGFLGQLFEGAATDRKIQRLDETLAILKEELEGVAELQAEYVRTEDFEDLTEKALRQAVDERHEEKRRLYARFIAGLARSEPASYDERRQQLRSLEELQLRHVDVLRTLAALDDGRIASKLPYELRRELMAIDHGHSAWTHANHEILDQLVAMGLARATPRSSALRLREGRGSKKAAVEGGRLSTSPKITDYGRRFFEFLES